MSEKKVVGRKVAIALGIVVLTILLSLVGVIANYTSIINEKDSIIATKDSQIQTITNQKNQLHTWLEGNITLLNTLKAQNEALSLWLEGNITYYNSQINSLNSQIDSLTAEITTLGGVIAALKAPKLVKVDLNTEDRRPFLQTPYLYVHGYICNVGTEPAYNARIHVVAYQSGGVIAIDTYIDLGTIQGETWTTVDAKIYYSGSALTYWELILEWTES